MINASQAFKDAMTPNIKNGVGVVVTVVEDNIVYSSDDVMQSVVIKSSGYYYGVNTRSATIKMLGVNYNLIGKTLKIDQAALTDPVTDVWERMNQGIFIVQEQTADLEKGCTTFTAYDLIGCMGKTDYKTEDGITFPCTVAKLAAQIANHFGLTLSTDFTKLPNYNYEIAEDLYASISTTTYRDILAEIGGATATMAIVTTDNELEFRPLARDISETWTYEDMKKFKVEPKYGEVNAIVLARTPQEDNIALTDAESVEKNGLTEVKLANNEILDDDRQDLIKPLLEASKGFYFYPSSVTTIGHGWHEVGDRVAIQDDVGNIYEIIITDISLTLDGGIKEVISSVAPVETQTNYALAGGIIKTLYNTEIKVDKQNQEIVSTVSKQDTLENVVNNNYTQIIQNLTSIVSAVQNSGGNNLIKNSVGYVLGANGIPDSWSAEMENAGGLTVMASSEAANRGSISSNIMVLSGVTLRQRISVAADDGAIEPTKYTFSVKIKKTAARGTGRITLTDGLNTYRIDIASEDEPYYQEYSIKGIVPKNSYLDLTVYGSENSDFTVTDMMLATGDYVAQWTQANGEFANTQVSIDVNGVKVKSSTQPNTYSTQTPLGFSGSDGTKSYQLDSNSVSSDKAIIRSEFDMPPLKIVSRSDGWALVKKEN